MRYAFCAFLGVVLLACGGAGSVPIAAGDKCVHCDQVITDTRFGTQLVSTNGQTSTFHTPGCLAKYLTTRPDGVKAVYVTDYNTGQMISVANALFVRAKADAGNERHYYAFRSATEAAKHAKEHSTTAVDWATVRTLAASDSKGN